MAHFPQADRSCRPRQSSSTGQETNAVQRTNQQNSESATANPLRSRRPLSDQHFQSIKQTVPKIINFTHPIQGIAPTFTLC